MSPDAPHGDPSLPPLRILVTDGDTRSALAVVRSLGRRGHAVFTGSERSTCIAAASRYSVSHARYPSPISDPTAFVAAIVDTVRTNSIDILIPTTDVTTLLLTESRSLLPETCRLPFASASSISEASDKARLMNLAQQLGVPIPTTLTAISVEDVARGAACLSYPVVVKPGRSRVRTNSGWLLCGIRYAHDAEELLALAAKLQPEAFPVLLQERINGAGVGVFACYDSGRAVALFSHRRLREKPPSGGVSVLSESVPLDPQAAEFATRLLNSLHWHGVAMVEFKRDDRDGSVRLMEINARFWGSLQLAVDAGVDFPALLVDLALGRPIAPVESYRVGVRSRWLLGDLDVLLATLRFHRTRLNLPSGFPTRGQFLRDFLRFWDGDVHYDVLQLHDPMPALVELRRWLTGR